MEIYIKPVEKIQLIKRKIVYLQDVAELYTKAAFQKELAFLPVFSVPQDQKRTYLLSVLDLIRCIQEKYPTADVSNVGAADILVEYLPEKKRGISYGVGSRRLLWQWCFLSVRQPQLCVSIQMCSCR